MKTRTKVILSIVSVLLAIAIILTSIFVPLAVSKKPVINSNEEVIRYIDASSLQNTTYEERGAQLFKQFDSYTSAVNDDGSMMCEGVATLNMSQLDQLNFVTSTATKVERKFKIKIDPETFDYNIIISYYQGDILLSRETIITQPYYIEEVDDCFFDLNNERYSIKELLVGEAINNCSVLALTGVALLVGGLIVSSIFGLNPKVPSAPSIGPSVGPSVGYRPSFGFFRRIGDFFKRLFNRNHTTTAPAVPVRVYKIVVNGQTYTLKKVVAITDDTFKESYKKQYRIAIRMNSDVLISAQVITRFIAVAILASNITVALEENGKKIYQLNTYTIAKSDAEEIASVAAPALGLVGANYHIAHCDNKNKPTGVYFQHYHPGPDDGLDAGKRTHSFFGMPTFHVKG